MTTLSSDLPACLPKCWDYRNLLLARILLIVSLSIPSVYSSFVYGGQKLNMVLNCEFLPCYPLSSGLSLLFDLANLAGFSDASLLPPTLSASSTFSAWYAYLSGEILLSLSLKIRLK